MREMIKDTFYMKRKELGLAQAKLRRRIIESTNFNLFMDWLALKAESKRFRYTVYIIFILFLAILHFL